MRGTVAKRIRRKVFGEGSVMHKPSARTYYTAPNGVRVSDLARTAYQKEKQRHAQRR